MSMIPHEQMKKLTELSPKEIVLNLNNPLHIEIIRDQTKLSAEKIAKNIINKLKLR